MAADCTVIAADHPDSAADEVIGEAGFLTEATVTDVTAVLRRALTGSDQQSTQRHTRDSSTGIGSPQTRLRRTQPQPTASGKRSILHSHTNRGSPTSGVQVATR